VSIRIEIQEQPERNRFWAEVEVGGMVARRKLVHSPREDGLAGMLAVVQATYDEMVPKPKAEPPSSPRPESTPDGARLLIGSHEVGDVVKDERGRSWLWEPDGFRPYRDGLSSGWPLERADESDIEALRAEAEAAGVDVDRRWGEARLRQEIASARPAVASLEDAWPSAPPGEP